MTDATNSLDQTEEEILNYEVSDESLETAAVGGNKAAYTMGFCTGLSAWQCGHYCGGGRRTRLTMARRAVGRLG
jgi:hypothetical protein